MLQGRIRKNERLCAGDPATTEVIMQIDELKSREIWLPYIMQDGKKPSLNGRTLLSWVKTPFRLSYDEALELQARTEGLDGVGFVVPIGR